MAMKAERVAVIILAAGQSTRFGAAKMKSFTNVTVVVSKEDKLSRTLSGLGVSVVVSENSINGMSQSIIAGVQSQLNADAWLIALGDMPYVKSETVSMLAEQSTINNIVVPVCDRRHGNPVIFGRTFQSSLISLQGDIGAKQLIQDNSSLVVKVSIQDQGVLLDIDQPDDLI